MSFVTTQPEELAAAAADLGAIGSAMAAQNAAAAAPTTGVMPAAADEVSALQATQFSAYGTLYQQVSAEAAAIHELLVHTLRVSADSYGTTEAANSAANSSSGLTGLLGSTGPLGASSNIANVGNVGMGNIASAASDLLGMASGGLLSNTVAEPGLDAAAALTRAVPTEGTSPTLLVSTTAVPGASAALPVTTGASPAAAVSEAPAGWTAATPVSDTAVASAGGAAAPHGASTAAVPAGMPSAASVGRAASGFGKPRYGVKPTVMPKPTVT